MLIIQFVFSKLYFILSFLITIHEVELIIHFYVIIGFIGILFFDGRSHAIIRIWRMLMSGFI